jgi:hypothetical protein
MAQSASWLVFYYNATQAAQKRWHCPPYSRLPCASMTTDVLHYEQGMHLEAEPGLKTTQLG